MAELPITPRRQAVPLQVGRLPLYQLPFTDSVASLLFKRFCACIRELWVCLKWHTSMHTSDDLAHIEYLTELDHPSNHPEHHRNRLEYPRNHIKRPSDHPNHSSNLQKTC